MKAIVIVAWIWTRTLPITKTIPKEMLPVGDKPVIQYVIECIVSAGIEDILMITSDQKKALEDYFDKDYELESVLTSKWKNDLLDLVAAPAAMGNFAFVRQKQPLWTAHAILQAEPWIADDYFLVVYGDSIYSPYLIVDILKKFAEVKTSILAVNQVPHTETCRYGCLRLDGDRALEIVEKPKIEDAPSDFVWNGVGLFHRSLFDFIKKTAINTAVNDYYITDTFNMLMQQQDVRIVQTDPFWDVGSIDSRMKANAKIYADGYLFPPRASV